MTISCMGISHKFNKNAMNIVGAPSMIHYNMGVSGAMVPQYLDVAKSIIASDSKRFSAIVI